MELSYCLLAVLLCWLRLDPAHTAKTSSSLDDWASRVQRSASHEEWAHAVKRSADFSRLFEEQDETAHIVDVQAYNRQMLAESRAKNRRLRERLLGTGMASAQSIEDSMAMVQTPLPIPGRYMVLFQEGTDDEMLDKTMAVMEQASVASDRRVRATDMVALRHIGKGFTATLNRKAVQLMYMNPAVEAIEQDAVVTRAGVKVHEEEENEGVASAQANKPGVTWNLDRLDQRDSALDQSYDPAGTGKNADVYILDSGMLMTHEEIKARAQYIGFDVVDEDTGTNQQGNDHCDGHGTHCAGVTAGKTYGVAKEATIYNVRVLECDGAGLVTGIVRAMDRVVEHNKKTGRPGVISQSLNLEDSELMDSGVKRATEAGVTCVSASGNQMSDSCKYSPGRVTTGISVGGTNQDDTLGFYTNTGKCTDIMAPGSEITSAWNTCDTCTRTVSGTSMAAPHVTGYIAILLSKHPDLTPAEVKQMMIDESTKDVVAMGNALAGTPNRMLYVTSKAEEARQSHLHG